MEERTRCGKHVDPVDGDGRCPELAGFPGPSRVCRRCGVGTAGPLLPERRPRPQWLERVLRCPGSAGPAHLQKGEAHHVFERAGKGHERLSARYLWPDMPRVWRITNAGGWYLRERAVDGLLVREREIEKKRAPACPAQWKNECYVTPRSRAGHGSSIKLANNWLGSFVFSGAMLRGGGWWKGWSSSLRLRLHSGH